MSQFEQAKSKELPKKTLALPLDFAEFIQQQMGIVSGEQAFDKFFLQANLVHKFIDQFLQAKVVGLLNRKFGFIKKESTIEMPMKNIDRLNQIWHGHVYLLAKRDPLNYAKVQERKIVYTKPQNESDYMRLPALKNLNPDGLHEKIPLIRIREQVLICEALKDLDVKQLVLEGGFFYRFKGKSRPMFRSKVGVLTSRDYTYWVSRPYYHNTINILTHIWYKNYAVVFVALYQVLQEMRLGTISEEVEDRVHIPDATELE